jgi:hypothetical protein
MRKTSRIVVRSLGGDRNGMTPEVRGKSRTTGVRAGDRFDPEKLDAVKATRERKKRA